VAIEQKVGTRALTRPTPGSLFGGGTAGNELLTAATGAVLIALLAGAVIAAPVIPQLSPWISAQSLHH
jgi:hypothetical protein